MFSFNSTKILECILNYRSDVVDRWGYLGDWESVIRFVWNVWAGRQGSRMVSVVLRPILLLFGLWIRTIEVEIRLDVKVGLVE